MLERLERARLREGSGERFRERAGIVREYFHLLAGPREPDVEALVTDEGSLSLRMTSE